MGSGRWLIDRYVGRTVSAYLLLVGVFLTGALAAQQAGRLLEALSATDAPGDAVLNILAALLPTLLTLAIPMAVLLAVIIGLSQLGSDSEIIAMQAAGLGLNALARPVLIISAAISLGALFLNLSVAPEAMRSLREIELRAAKYKLESPVEPRTFNTKIPEYVLYIREGDRVKGVWQNVFIFNQQANGKVRLITAREGRIDFAKEVSGQGSELFLQDAVMLSSMPDKTANETAGANSTEAWTVDRAGQTRLTFPTNRQDILQRLEKRPFEFDEMTLGELRKLAAGPAGPEQRSAAVQAQKKLALSFGPLVMGLLGVSLGSRVRRGGRGAGLVLGFVALVIYQLVALVGEQLARKGTLPPIAGVWLGPGLATLFSLFWLTSRNRRFGLRGWLRRLMRKTEAEKGIEANEVKPEPTATKRVGGRNSRYWSSFPAYLDWSALRTLAMVFALTLSLLTFLFLTFTLFELWRFIAPGKEGYLLVARYLFYLLPLTLGQTLPGAGLIAALTAYALMARRLEAVAWWSSGLSAYRLMLPCFIFALALCLGFWWLQERVMPTANITQDTLRAQIKGSPKGVTPTRQWLAPSGSTTLYSYSYDETSGALRDVSIYLFAGDQTHLKQVIRAERAIWDGASRLDLQEVEEIQIINGQLSSEKKTALTLPVNAPAEVFKPAADKPSQLSAEDLRGYVKASNGRGETVALLATSLQAKYAAPFGAFALILLGAPLALAFDRRRILNALGAAVLASLVFWILTNVCQQFGVRGILPPVAAAWTPTALFSCLTLYLLSRTRT